MSEANIISLKREIFSFSESKILTILLFEIKIDLLSDNPFIGSITFTSCITKSIFEAELQLNNIRIINKYLFIKHVERSSWKFSSKSFYVSPIL